MTDFDWPRDAEGNPMCLITVGSEEKIGLPNYSNVVVGPIRFSRFVKDTTEDRYHGAKGTMIEVEKIMGEERQVILDAVKGQLK